MQKTEIKSEALQYSTLELIRDVLGFIKPYRFKFWTTTLVLIVRELLTLYPTFALASIVTFVTKYKIGQSLTPVYTLLGIWLGVMLLRSVTNYYGRKLGIEVGERVGIDSNLKVIRHMFKLDMVWHEKENTGNKLKRIQNAGRGFEQVIRIWFINILEIIVSLVAINIIISSFDTTVLFLLIIFCLLYFLISNSMKKKAGNALKEANIEDEKLTGLLFEGMNNIRTVKVMSMASTLESRIARSAEELYGKIKRRIFWFQSRSAILIFFPAIFRIGIIALIIQGIVNGHYEIGFLILFNSYFNDIQSSIEQLANASIDLTTHRLSIARVKAILNEPVNIDKEEGKVSFPKDWQKIKIENVSFAYEDNKVLDNVSFEIKKGEKIGIVGLSGAGKSTLFKLLLKEREEFTGQILFDDTSIKDIYKPSYFEKVSVVLQDTEVFNFSLKENITITNSSEIENENLLNTSLDTAHLGEVAQKLPHGLDTLIGEKGVKLSGGERQRLGLARAIFKQPDILLLDEATSHLDIESEEKIRDSLHQFFENITAVVIAHRLTTIKEMDKILVLEDGRIIEEGSFAKLYKKKGRFYELWEKQKI